MTTLYQLSIALADHLQLLADELSSTLFARSAPISWRVTAPMASNAALPTSSLMAAQPRVTPPSAQLQHSQPNQPAGMLQAQAAAMHVGPSTGKGQRTLHGMRAPGMQTSGCLTA